MILLMSELEKFLEERKNVPIPKGDVAPVKLLAKEMVLGVHRGLWGRQIGFDMAGGFELLETELENYFKHRWNGDVEHNIELLKLHKYIIKVGKSYELSEEAVSLLDETEPYNIFISYKRSENSMFALLVNNTLQLNGFAPFFDMFLKPTDDWHARLEERVKTSAYFIALLGPDTHKSKYTVREINWALTHGIPVVQIWKHNFTLKSSEWQSTKYPEVAERLEQQKAILVKTDDAEGIHLALQHLLNAVGIIQ